MSASIYDWSTTAASNTAILNGLTLDGAVMTVPQLDNAFRDQSAQIAMFRDDITGTITAGGTANALTVTANSGFTTYANGRMVAFIAASDNTSAATLSVNAIGAKSIRKMDTTGDVALVGAEIQAGGVYLAIYNTALNAAVGGWLLVNPTGIVPASPTETSSSSGTSIDFTGIPSWATEITLVLTSVSTNGTSNLICQLGDSGGIETSGYLGAGSVSTTPFSTSFVIALMGDVTYAIHGIITLRRAVASSNIWVCSSTVGREVGLGSAIVYVTGGSKATSATLDRVRITTSGGDTFDAGAITMSYR